MAGGIDWFRWHHGTVMDHKFPIVAKRSGASVAEVVAVWAFLLEEASASSDRGALPAAPDFEALDCALGMADGLSARIFTAMVDRNLLDTAGDVVQWHRRQPQREREDNTATERKRAQRARDATNTVPVTPCHAESHQITPRVEESREEEKGARASGEDAEQSASTPTAYGLAAKALRVKGVEAHPGEQRLRALVDAGVTIEEFESIAVEAALKAKGFAWCMSTLTGRRAELAASPIAERPPPRENPDFAATRERLRAEAAREIADDPQTIAAARAAALALKARRTAPPGDPPP